MNSISYSRLRANLKSACDAVCDSHEPVFVERKNGGDVVIMAREDFDSQLATASGLRTIAVLQRPPDFTKSV